MQKSIFYKIPLSRPDITRLEKNAVLSVLSTPYLSLGPRIKEFEAKISTYIGIKYAIAVSNRTCGLHLIIRALGIKDGDEVITTPFSFTSSPNCILYERAKPVFVDIDPLTLNIDPTKIERAITKMTKAILVVDNFAYPADWDKLQKIARKYDLKLIEDSAEALGSEYKGKKCGTFAEAGIFSFYPNKQITCG
jgi:perosamine synthetase